MTIIGTTLIEEKHVIHKGKELVRRSKMLRGAERHEWRYVRNSEGEPFNPLVDAELAEELETIYQKQK